MPDAGARALLRRPLGLCSAMVEKPYKDMFKHQKEWNRCPPSQIIRFFPRAFGAIGFSWVPQGRAGPQGLLPVQCPTVSVGFLTRCVGAAGWRTCEECGPGLMGGGHVGSVESRRVQPGVQVQQDTLDNES